MFVGLKESNKSISTQITKALSGSSGAKSFDLDAIFEGSGTNKGERAVGCDYYKTHKSADTALPDPDGDQKRH